MTASEWAQDLSEDQLRCLVVKLVSYLEDVDYVKFGNRAPYWTSCGEPLVEGQVPFDDEDEEE